MSDAGTISITARTLDLAREALGAWLAEHPAPAQDRWKTIGRATSSPCGWA